MDDGSDAKWTAALGAASRLAPAEEWRVSLARAVREAARADLVYMCPPDDWGQHFQSSVYPGDHAAVARVAESFLPRIEQCGEGFRYAIAHHGLVYAPLDVAQHRPLAEEMRGAILVPVGLRGWVCTSILDDAGALVGTLVVGTSRPSSTVIERAGARLDELSAIAGRTLGGAIRLAAGCRPAPPASLAALTARERQIAQLAAEGLRNANIAARLDIAEGTVAVHIKRIYGKLGVASRVDLAMRCRG